MDILIPSLMVLLGLASYHFRIMASLHAKLGRLVWFTEYFKTRPFKCLGSVTGAFMGAIIVFYGGIPALEWLNVPTSAHEASMMGLYGFSGLFPYWVADYVGQKYKKVIETETTSEELDISQGEYVPLPKECDSEATKYRFKKK